MAIVKETVVIGGHLKAREVGSGLPFQKVGLVSTIQHATETNSLTLADTTTPQGGEYDSLDRVTSVSLSINFREIFSWVLAALVWGNVTSVAATTVTGEEHVADVDGTIALAQMPLTISNVSNEAATTDYDEFDDWVMTGSGIEVVSGGALEAAIKAAAPGTPFKVSVDYSSAAVDVIEALTNSGKTFEFLFEGENAAGTQKRVEARFFQCRLNLATQMDWINTEDFGGFQATAKVLRDSTKVGAGTSKYFKIKKEKAAA
ncbi:phage tail tube protein [Pseudomonas nicosulfuronedens]